MSRFSDRHLREGRALPEVLEVERQRILGLAKAHGLDLFETVFEMCTYEEINMIAAYGGFPTRYPHWRFGMDFLQTQTSYEYGLSKIYEMVINTDPATAYLMDCNLMVDQKLVMAHVYGHVDFFKNNAWFAGTDRKMLDTMANHATRIRQLMERHGTDEVERVIDMGLSLDNLIDPFPRPRAAPSVDEVASPDVGRLPAKSYMDPHVNPKGWLREQRAKAAADAHDDGLPDKDVLAFVLRNAPLPAWKAEILQIIHDEAMYFAPQAQTKIMNEGWATYWHTHLMTQHVLEPGDVIDYCDHHAGTVVQQPGRLNPYKLGVELWRHIERRWDRGQFGRAWLDVDHPAERAKWDTGAHQGRAKLFEVRRTHNDVTFLDTFLTEDFCKEQGFFTTRYDEKAGEHVFETDAFADVKRGLLQMLASRGTPRISVVDANAYNRGELLLAHQSEGIDLDLDQAERVLGHLAALWGRSVHLTTHLGEDPMTLRHDGVEFTRGQGHP